MIDRVATTWMRSGVAWERDKDLIVFTGRGMAFQEDMCVTAKYDAAYFDKVAQNDESPISDQINDGRLALVARHVGKKTLVCDVGVGTGEFVRRRRGSTFGIDVNPISAQWLKGQGLWAHDLRVFEAFTFWDVIEHVREPQTYLDHVPIGGFAFFSVPTFGDLRDVRISRHYRPGEHLYYWTGNGFKCWLEAYGFELAEVNDFESVAGRESISSFAFRRLYARL